jgi:hypothetical protein
MSFNPQTDVSPEERGFERVEEGETLFSGGETQDATGQEFEQLFKVRESGGQFVPQLVKEDEEGKIVGKQTLGRKRRDREEAVDTVETRLGQRTAPGQDGFPVGDFVVESNQKVTQAQAAHLERSDRAVTVDNQNRAPVTTDVKRYMKRPGELDYPGVDTPTTDPKALPKDFKRGGTPDTTDVDEETEVATGSERSGFDMFPEAAAGGDSSDPFLAELGERDVSLSPDEAFGDVGRTGETALGGFRPGFGEQRPGEEVVGSRTGADRREPQGSLENVRPPEEALREQGADDGDGELFFASPDELAQRKGVGGD